ncbi:hypothetical protein GALMADRAFT_258869 [Galerina marginata CBS 339.88]|uniref:Uncharacterized protein n=1 Tax=Galerina marginata (strain CBS 339.88) TaxID=685588 RepID=A0A067S9V0_GALM3|nr:hypothetical protein GALMADRAFT_258869 [Galerina marginata CBS 339.88]
MISLATYASGEPIYLSVVSSSLLSVWVMGTAPVSVIRPSAAGRPIWEEWSRQRGCLEEAGGGRRGGW